MSSEQLNFHTPTEVTPMKIRMISYPVTCSIIFLVVVAVVCVPTVANGVSSEYSKHNKIYTDDSGAKVNCNRDTGRYNIDGSIISATSHWILLTLGQKDQKHLLELIGSWNVPDTKKKEWRDILKQLWNKYPVKIEQGENYLRITLEHDTQKIRLSTYEESILGEIDDYIGHAMEENLNSEITPMWLGPTHDNIFSSACIQKSGLLLQDYCKYPIDNRMAEEPDSWCEGDPICQMYNHGFLPGKLIPEMGIGLAPSNIQKNATEAYTKINSGEYQSGFGSLAHASHFLEDLGNPLHTGAFYQVGSEIFQIHAHSAYENYVKDNWDTDWPGTVRPFSDYVEQTTEVLWNSDPLHSGVSLAVDSSKDSDALIRYIYVNFIENGDFNLAEDSDIRDITIKNLIETRKYTNGLITYAASAARIFTITSDAGPNGKISPSGVNRVLYKQDATFAIIPNSGYDVADVRVDGKSIGAVTGYSFTDVEAPHTILGTFMKAPPSLEWVWSRDGWNGWTHSATWTTCYTAGGCHEWGPMMIDDHGQHGSDVSLKRGTTSSYVQHQFTNPSGEWNTLTFVGDIGASSVPEGRWMTIEVNGNQVFAATTQQTPPGNTQEKFAITVQFPASNSVDVKISQGQSPAWGEYFIMDFYSLKLRQRGYGPNACCRPSRDEYSAAGRNHRGKYDGAGNHGSRAINTPIFGSILLAKKGHAIARKFVLTPSPTARVSCGMDQRRPSPSRVPR